jgi:hypothetical protein
MNPHFTYLDGQLSARCDKFPSTLVPCLVTAAPPLGFYSFHPFLTPQFTLHNLHRQHQQSRPSSSRTVVMDLISVFFGSLPLTTKDYLWLYCCSGFRGISRTVPWKRQCLKRFLYPFFHGTTSPCPNREVQKRFSIFLKYWWSYSYWQ